MQLAGRDRIHRQLNSFKSPSYRARLNGATRQPTRTSTNSSGATYTTASSKEKMRGGGRRTASSFPAARMLVSFLPCK